MQEGNFQETSAGTFVQKGNHRFEWSGWQAAINLGRIPTSQFVASICQSQGPLIMPFFIF